LRRYAIFKDNDFGSEYDKIPANNNSNNNSNNSNNKRKVKAEHGCACPAKLTAHQIAGTRCLC
jgi:hypothetical protein